LGKGVTVRDGNDAAIIATGFMVHAAIEASSILKNEGINARVIDIHTIKPIDKELIIKAARETGAIVTAEEHTVMGGLGGAVTEVVSENYPVPVKLVGVQDKFGKSGKPDKLVEIYGLTAANIVEKVKEAIKMKR
jgi:transketolase